VTYNRTLAGPHPDSSFLVHTGVVAVVGSTETVLLPPGVVWPGVGALSEELMDWLCPAETFLGAKDAAVPWMASPRDIESTTALVQVQWVRSRALLSERFGRLSTLVDVEGLSQASLATMLGASRESLSCALSLQRARNRHAAD
jgi:hypothetical protein